MKRLRDEIDSPDPLLSEAALLVSQVPPLAPSEVRARRVRRALDRAPQKRRVGGFVLAFGIVLGVVGTAGAVMGVARLMNAASEEEGLTPHGLSPHGSETLPVKSPSSEGASSEGKRSPSENGEQSAGEQDASTVGSTVGSTQFVSKQLVSERAGTQGAETRQQSTSPSATSAASKSAAPSASLSEARLMQQAVEALRSSGDPDKAEKLLQQYRQSSSSGRLDEEALALSIEVSLARKDGNAASYARRYLAAYPGGKFTPLAKKALAQESR